MGQRDFVNKLLAAQTDVQDAKDALATRVDAAKSAILYGGRPTQFDIQQATEIHQLDIGPNDFEGAGNIDPYDLQQSAESREDLRDDIIREAYINPLHPTSPVVGKTKRGANIHADGTYSVVTPEGKIHAGLTHEQADRYSVYSKQEVMEEATGAAEGFIPRKLTGIKDQLVDIVTGFVQGPLMGGDGTTLEEQVQARNYDITSRYKGTEGVAELKARTDDPRAQTLGKIMGETDQLTAERNRQQDQITPPKPLITPEQIEQYKKVKDTVNFETATPLFKELRSLERFANWNKMIYERSEKVAAKLKSVFPASYKDQVAAKAGFDAVAEDKGTWEAIKYTFDNDLGTLLSSGIDSTPWMIAYTIGGPITQTAVLTTLARSKGLQGIEEFKTKYGRIPTAEETQRIKLWQAIGSIAEKYGDLSALKALKGQLTIPFLKNINKALTANTSGKVLSLASIVAIRTSGALGGEALSGATTSYSEQIAEHGEVVDPATIAYDALAEAAGTPGGMATMYLGNLPFAVAEQRSAGRTKNEETLISDLEGAETLLATITEKQKNKQKLTKREVISSNAEEIINNLLNQFTGYELPVYESEDQIPLDENGDPAPTTNANFNKIYNHFRAESIKVTDETGTQEFGGLDWQSALAKTEQGMELSRTEYTDALADLNRVINDKDTRQLKRNLQAAIPRLKQELEEKKFSNKERKKRIKDAEENVPPRTYKSKKQKAEEAATETEKDQIKKQKFSEKVDAGIEEIQKNTKKTNKQKISELNEILNDADKEDIALTDKQRKQVEKTLKELAPVESEETDTKDTFINKLKKALNITPKEEEETLSSLRITYDPANENPEESKANDKILEDLSNTEGLSPTDIRVLAAVKKKREHFKKLQKLERSEKTQKQVNEEVVSGTATGYKGFSTFREKIIELLDINRTADEATQGRNKLNINNQLAQMKQHLENLENKLAKFKEAKEKNKKLPKGSKTFWVVEGTRDEESNTRKMVYTLQEVTQEEYNDLRNKQKLFYSHIHGGSQGLLNQIAEEIAYGKEAVFIAENHNKTSFFQNVERREKQIAEDKALAEQIIETQKHADTLVPEFTAASVENIQDPTTKESPDRPTGVVDPTYANLSNIDLAKLKIDLESEIAEINSAEYTSRTEQTKANARLDTLLRNLQAINTTLANKPADTTPPVAPSSEGREGATVQETTPPKVEEVVKTEAPPVKKKVWTWPSFIKSLTTTEKESIREYLKRKTGVLSHSDIVDFLNNPQTILDEFTEIGITPEQYDSEADYASNYLDGVKLLHDITTKGAVKTEVQEETQRKDTDETPQVEEQTKATTEDQGPEGKTPISEPTPPVTESSPTSPTEDGDTGQKRPKSKIPVGSESKTAFRYVFPEIINELGLLVQDQELIAKHQELFEEVAEILGVAANYKDVADALFNLPESTNFFEENPSEDTKFKTITKEQLDTEAKAKFKEEGKESKSVAERIANRAENILGILGKSITDLIKIKTNKNALNKIPGFIFENDKYLLQAFKDLGLTDTSAKVLVSRWKDYKKKYERIRIQEKEFKGPIYASSQPLNLLHLITNTSKGNEHRLPNQVVFMMMLANTNFIRQRLGKGTQPFMNKFAFQDFLYSGKQPVSDEEQAQLDALGFNYEQSALQVGNQIAIALNLQSVIAPEYYEKLKVALGSQALQVDHKIFSYDNGDPTPRKVRDKIIPDKTGRAISQEEKDSAPYSAIAPYQIGIYTFNFKDDWKPGRNYNNRMTSERARALEKEHGLTPGSINERGEYKHIRMNPNADSWAPAFIDALAEANQKLKLGLDEDNPNQSPTTEVNTFIRNSIGEISQKIRNVIIDKQAVEWSDAESLGIVGFLANSSNKNRTIIDRILGVDAAADDPNTHKELRQSLASSNRTTLANFNNTLKAWNKGTIKKFFVTYKLQNQLRYLMQGPVNPQQDKNVRFLVKSADAIEYSEKNIHLFQLAVAYNFGIKVDKHNLPYAIKQFKAILSDPAVLASVQLMNEINKLKDANPNITSEELNKDGLLDKFAESLQEVHSRDRHKKANIALVGAITALSRYMTVTGTRNLKSRSPQQGFRKSKPNKTFKSDIPLDMDGISNGFAINVLQFPNFQNTDSIDKLIEVLAKVGIYKGDSPDKVVHDVYAPDSYQSLAKLMSKYTSLANKKVKNYLKDNKIGISNEEQDALHRLYPQLLDSSGNLEDLRDLVKYPFLIYLYGGGIASISEGVGKEIMTEMLKKLDRHQKTYNDLAYERGTKNNIKFDQRKQDQTEADKYYKETWLPFINDLSIIGALKRHDGKQSSYPAHALRKNKTQTWTFESGKATSTIGRIVRPRLDIALTEMLGPTERSRKAVIKAGELINAMFIVTFEKEYAAHLKETKRDYLTEKEIHDFIRSNEKLNRLYPEYRIPKQIGKGTIDLTSREQTEQQDRASEVQVWWTNLEGKKKTNTVIARTIKFVLPGPAALTRTIMNIDAAAMTMLLGTSGLENLLGLHDGVMGNPIQLGNGATAYGNKLVELNLKNNILENMYLLAQSNWESLTNPDGTHSELQTEINKWFHKNSFDNKLLKEINEPTEGMETVLEQIEEASEKNTQDRLALSEYMDGKMQAVNHMYLANKTAAEIKAIVAERIKSLTADIKTEENQKIKDALTAEIERLKKFKFKETSRTTPEQTEIDEAIDNANSAEVEQINEETLTTLEELPRENEETISLTHIKPGSVRELFKSLKRFSQNYYRNSEEQDNHSAFLNDIVEMVEGSITGLEKLIVNWEEIDGVTQGKYSAESKIIRVSLSRQGPESNNAAGPQEVYIHELVHAMTFFALRESPELRNRIEKMYKLVERTVTHKTFLPKGRTPTPADTERAKQEYNFIFDNPDNEEHRLDEFLAYALTNKELIEHLKDMPVPKRLGLLNKLVDLLKQVLVSFQKAMGVKAASSTQDTVYAEMFAIAERLVAIHNKHESAYKKTSNRFYGFLDISDNVIIKAAVNGSKAIMNSEALKKSKLGRVTIGVVKPIYYLLSQNAVVLAAKVKFLHYLGKTIRGVVHEVSEAGSITKEMVDRVIQSRYHLQKVQRQIERRTQDWFNGDKKNPEKEPGIWKSRDLTKPHAMSIEERVSLTTTLFRTDLSSLLGAGYTPAQIAELVDNNSGIEREKTKILKQVGHTIGGLSRTDDVIKYTKDLGYWTVVGQHRLPNGHTNIQTIAKQYGITDEQQIRLLDAYASLSALQELRVSDPNALNLVKNLIDDEFNASPDENAIIDLLDSHLAYVEESRATIFKDNQNQMVKGFIIERVDDLTKLEAGQLSDKKAMKRKGFRHHESLTKIPGIPNINDTLYISYTTPDAKDQAGMIPTRNQRNMGTTLTEILANNPKFQIDGRPNYGLIKAEIAKVKKREAKKPVSENHENKLTPLRDDNHNIVDYRVMLSHKQTKKILNPDLEIQNVFGHMRSSLSDRQHFMGEAKLSIDVAIDDYVKLWEEKTDKQWVDLLDPDQRYIERFRKFPKSLRTYVLAHTVNGKFKVREDVVDKVFGYRPYTFGDAPFLQKEGKYTEQTKYWVNNAHSLIREMIGFAKDRIVIAMPEVVISNLVSNIFRLGMAKIPPDYVVAKIEEGRSEYFKYRDLSHKEFKLKNLIKTRKLNTTSSPEAKELMRVKAQMKLNRIHRMAEAGLDTLIVEDLNDAQTGGYINKAKRMFRSDKFNKITSKIPPRLLETASYIYWTRGITPYQHMRTIVQMTDFLARYVMIEYDVEVKGMPFEEAKHKAIDSFVLFDELLLPALELLESTGTTSFLSYALRNQRGATQAIKASPTSVGISAVIQDATGIPTLGNLNAAWVTGDITPNLWQFDDLLDEATSATGFEVVRYFGDILEEVLD